MSSQERTAWGYVRVSTGKQDTSPKVQESTMRAYHEYALKETHKLVIAEPDVDVSGTSEFFQRPAGIWISRRLQPGDAIVFAKLDRGFRDVADLILTTRKLSAMDVSVRFLDFNIDTATSVGKFVLTCMAAAAEWERERITERIRETMAERKRRGQPTGRAPYGFKNVGPQHKRRYAPDPKQREAGKLFVYLRDVLGLSIDQMTVKAAQMGIKNRDGNLFSRSAIHWTYQSELELQEKERGNVGREADDGEDD